MIYRRLDKEGDYILGQGSTQFLSGSEAIGQALVTHIKLLLQEWWEDLNTGTPLWQSMLGKPGSEINLRSIDNILRSRILSLTFDNRSLIYSIDSYQRTYDINQRKYSFEATVTTIYGESISINQEFSIG